MKLDFFEVTYSKYLKNKHEFIDVYPDFKAKPSKDLMIRGGKFYAVVDKETGLWTQDEFKIQEIVDEELKNYIDTELAKKEGQHVFDDKLVSVNVRYMVKFRSKSWIEYKSYISSLPDHYHQLDDKLCFAKQAVKQSDYISKCLPYELKEGSYEAWDELVGTLYSPEEKQKLEWAIGAIVTGDSKDIQKFVVLYGDPGAGKGTIIKIIQMLFPGYYEMFDAKSLSSNSNAFAFEQFRSNPLIALQTDGDLSRIDDNTKLNSLISHETIVMNEKRKQSYNFTPKCFLFMASNKPVQITDSKSGILRRLIDVSPTGNTLPKKEYDRLMSQIGFELSGIAWHCREVYLNLGKNYYNGYKPLSMVEKTNGLYNFILDKYDELDKEDGIFLGEAFSLWEKYCDETGMQNYMKRYVFKEELKSYFVQFDEYKKIGKETYRGWYTHLNSKKFKDGFRGKKDIPHDDPTFGLVLDKTESLLDEMLKDCMAQYGQLKPEGGSKPRVSWDDCKTTLKDLDTHELHFVRVPLNHIVIDFDLKNEKGEKDALLNLEAADKWPKTYAEYSQGGKGIHLHYIYNGDPTELERLYANDIEIKVYTGKQSVRRRLSLCNNIPVATIDGSGLPKKEGGGNKVIDFETVKNEQHLINIVSKCLRKDIAQPYTAPAMSLIKKTLDDAYESGISYDIRDMRPAIRAFAAKSSHQKETCMKMEMDLHYCSKNFESSETPINRAVTASSSSVDNSSTKEPETLTGPKNGQIEASESKDYILRSKQLTETRPMPQNVDETLVFFDCEVFPNLLLVNWKEAGEGKGIVRMINPTRSEINELLHKKLVGFNCRRYDNHILYARLRGYDIPAIYRLSQRIIEGSKNAMFGEAFNLSYTDVYDFAAKKQSLKKWEIELKIHHQELGLPWDQPVPEERWAEVAKYCDNDVIATEAVFNKLAGDFKAREILADIAGMTVNDTTNSLTTKIIFGDDPNPQRQFIYPDLAAKFPGYRFANGKSYYRHEIPLIYNSKTEIQHYQDIYKDRYIRWTGDNRTVVVDEEIGEGGRVYANPGIYYHVVTYDVASMHPSSIIAENGFGIYTDRFKQLLDIRIAIKHKDFEKAKTMLDGKLAKYLTDKDQAKALSQALKIAINSVYGLTAAGFDNKFKDPRNKDNWVAKRGALFIETLRLNVEKMGAKVVHIKTDSIKIENPTEEVTNYILNYGKQWGYNFEVEDIYEKICLVNDAVYIALRDRKDPSWLDECEKAKKKAEETHTNYIQPTRWTATGAQFQHPYVFKHLFSGEEVEFYDLCETKSVTSALYLDMNENLSDVSAEEKEYDKISSRVKKLLKSVNCSTSYEEWIAIPEKTRKQMANDIGCSNQDFEKIDNELADLKIDLHALEESIAKGHNYIFIGKAGSFCPVSPGFGGGILVRQSSNGKYSAATGSKGHRWREAETLKSAERMDMIDMGYFEELAMAAREAVQKYGDFDEFTTEYPEGYDYFSRYSGPIDEVGEALALATGEPGRSPWAPPCGDEKYMNCYDCPYFKVSEIPPKCAKGYNLKDWFAVNTDYGNNPNIIS